MGKIDTVTKEYLSHNDVFADAFNFFLYGGRQVIKPDELRELDTTEMAVIRENGVSEAVQKFRDGLKEWAARAYGGTILAILGTESQAKIHYAMPGYTRYA